MGTVDSNTWMEHLAEADCWKLIRLSPIGRVGVLIDSAPEVYPVNFAVDDQRVVFRTDPGSKLRAIDRSPSVCFEVDGIDLADHSGSSVLIKGRATEIHDPDELGRVTQLPLRPWALGEKEHWVSIDPVEMTGRRVWNLGS